MFLGKRQLTSTFGAAWQKACELALRSRSGGSSRGHRRCVEIIFVVPCCWNSTASEACATKFLDIHLVGERDRETSLRKKRDDRLPLTTVHRQGWWELGWAEISDATEATRRKLLRKAGKNAGRGRDLPQWLSDDQVRGERGSCCK